MGHVTQMPLRRRPTQFFGTDCQIEAISNDAIERRRIEDENMILRADKDAMAAKIAELSVRIAECERTISAGAANEEILSASLRKSDEKILTMREAEAVLNARIDDLVERCEDAEQTCIEHNRTIARLYDELCRLRSPSERDFRRAECNAW